MKQTKECRKYIIDGTVQTKTTCRVPGSRGELCPLLSRGLAYLLASSARITLSAGPWKIPANEPKSGGAVACAARSNMPDDRRGKVKPMMMLFLSECHVSCKHHPFCNPRPTAVKEIHLKDGPFQSAIPNRPLPVLGALRIGALRNNLIDMSPMYIYFLFPRLLEIHLHVLAIGCITRLRGQWV